MKVVIVGAGIAGLYAAYKLTADAAYAALPVSITILEKNSYPGGRALNTFFAGHSVPLGAGIGRWKKDKLLRKLLEDLEIPIRRFVAKTHYAFDEQPIDVIDTVRSLKAAKAAKATGAPEAFGSFARKVLGPRDYKRFILTTGYTDDLKGDAEHTIKNYGHDDNAGDLDAFYVPWKELIDKLVALLKSRGVRIKYNQEVNAVDAVKGVADAIILATPIDALMNLIPKNSAFSKVKSQPFIRVYATFSKGGDLLRTVVPSATHVKGPLQKIIPMFPLAKRPMYMIAYADNDNAKLLKSPLEKEDREYFSRKLESTLTLPKDSLEITSMTGMYWPIGTHYFTKSQTKNTLSKLQKPTANVWVVGEAVAMHQGWVEGALESVVSVEMDIKITLEK